MVWGVLQIILLGEDSNSSFFLGRVDVRSTTRFVALDRLLLLEGAIKLAYPWLKVEVSQ